MQQREACATYRMNAIPVPIPVYKIACTITNYWIKQKRLNISTALNMANKFISLQAFLLVLPG